jgi:hypothetical protein
VRFILYQSPLFKAAKMREMVTESNPAQDALSFVEAFGKTTLS